MKPSDLHAVWSAPDNSRLTAKQSSFRLPVHVAAKLSALCELYPGKTRTQVVGDLLSVAIDAIVEGLPSAKGKLLLRGQDENGEPLEIYEEVGALGRFKQSANRHYMELERELGNDAPALLYPTEFTSNDPRESGVTFTFEELHPK